MLFFTQARCSRIRVTFADPNLSLAEKRAILARLDQRRRVTERPR